MSRVCSIEIDADWQDALYDDWIAWNGWKRERLNILSGALSALKVDYKLKRAKATGKKCQKWPTGPTKS